MRLSSALFPLLRADFPHACGVPTPESMKGFFEASSQRITATLQSLRSTDFGNSLSYNPQPITRSALDISPQSRASRAQTLRNRKG